jgi:hypothetical protein
VTERGRGGEGVKGKGRKGGRGGGNVILKREGEKKFHKIKTKRQGATKIIWLGGYEMERTGCRKRGDKQEREGTH